MRTAGRGIVSCLLEHASIFEAGKSHDPGVA